MQLFFPPPPPYRFFNSFCQQSFGQIFVIFLQKGRWVTPSVQRRERFVHRPIGKRGLDKPYFFPPGVSVLNKKKEGRCTHIWCSCHLNLFQHLCIIFLLSGTRAFQMSLRRPIWDAFSVIPYKRDAAECAAEVDRYLMGYTNL